MRAAAPDRWQRPGSSAVSFSGFNPLLNHSYNVPAGAYLTMVTALKVKLAQPVLSVSLVSALIAVLVVAGGAVWALLRRSKSCQRRDTSALIQCKRMLSRQAAR